MTDEEYNQLMELLLTLCAKLEAENQEISERLQRKTRNRNSPNTCPIEGPHFTTEEEFL